MPLTRNLLPLALILTASAVAQQSPTPAAAAWWHQTTALANDSMEGRDTGTEAYERAAKYVAGQFSAAGLKPAGDNGTFFQRVPMHQVDLDTTRSSVEVESVSGGPTGSAALKLLEDVTLQPSEHLPPSLRAPLKFIGYGLDTSTGTPKNDDKGMVLVYFAGTPSNLPAADRRSFATRRAQRLTTSGAAATVAILNPADIEPFHWPAAYARSVILAETPSPASPTPSLRISTAAAATLFSHSGADLPTILRDAERGAPLPTLDLHANLRLHLETTAKDISSPNILAILPGSDPALAPEYVALSAHLDGYGYGTPVNGDNLYNGALDDAAYVATLLELARTQAALPPPQRPKRSLLFCIFTGEEKGLLGSAYFTRHPTVPIPQIVADLNLDQLRPIFPLRILTMEGIADSTLGDTARTVAQKYSIELRPDLEPERNLFRRADNYNFVRVGVPVAGFIFGYNRGTSEEVIYRDWYARRYHKPQDDLSTPIDWQAAATFNDFYRDLARAVADSTGAPKRLPSSPTARTPSQMTPGTQFPDKRRPIKTPHVYSPSLHPNQIHGVPPMLKGFRDFILRGNVIDLAVAVIIGAAFTSIVNSLVGDIINPLIAAIVGKPDFSALTLSVHGGVIKYGDFLNAAISFALIAFVVYFFIVLPVNTLLLRLRGPAPSSTKPCPQCLGDIPLAATRCKFCAQPIEALPSGRL